MPNPGPTFSHFPGKRVSVGGLIKNAVGHLLIVKPSYREGWLLPGGVVEEDESPAVALLREVNEEVGLACHIRRLICVDYVERNTIYGESLHFLFECTDQIANTPPLLHVEASELSDARFVPFEKALEQLVPTAAARLRACWSFGGKTLYLEGGHKLIPSTS